MNIQRVMAIFEKDLKDFTKNMMLLLMPFIPILLALLYDRMGDDLPLSLLYLIVGITFSAVTSSLIMTMMAEENEKKTLRGLIQSPASFVDIILGKSLVTALVTAVSLIISLLIIGIEPFLTFQVALILLVLFLFFILLGIGIGLFAKSIASTSAYLMPIMLLFGFTPMFSQLGFAEDGTVMSIFNTFPIMQALDMHETGDWMPLGIMALWVLAALLFVFVSFKKTTVDD